MQQVGDDGTGHGDRLIACLVQRRDIQVSGHHAGIAVIDVTFERQQLHTVQACPVMMNGRQRIMGIFGGIAMSGEMLGDRQDALPFQPTGIRKPFVSHRLRILAEGAEADHRVVGIAVDIHIGCEIDMDSHLLALPGDFLAVFGYQAVILNRPQHHVLRETGRTGEAHGKSPFAVQRHEHRDTGGFLQAVRHLGLRDRITFMEKDAADLYLIDITHQALHIAGVGFRVGDDHKELPDTFVITHRIEDGVHPVIHFLLVHCPVKVRCRLCNSGKNGNTNK